MRLQIHNINKVRQADIKLEGFTVIAGVNGSGKSTVGKLLFSMIKSLNYANDNANMSRGKRLSKRVEELYRRASKCFSRYDCEVFEDVFLLPTTKMFEKLLSSKEISG